MATVPSSRAAGRPKISTTVAAETMKYLQGLVRRREATNLGAAVDLLVERDRGRDMRERLEHDTAAYFAALSPAELAEENALGSALTTTQGRVDYDRQP